MNEQILIWNSAYKNRALDNNADCSVSFASNTLGDMISFKVKSVTLTNTFPNIYGLFRNLWIEESGVTSVISVPEGHYETYAEVDTMLKTVLEAVVGSTVTPTTDADGFLTITSTTPFKILNQEEIKNIPFGKADVVSLNQLLGQRVDNLAAATPYTFTDRVNLTGVRKVRIGSSTIASSHSIHPRDLGDILTSLSLHDVDFGQTKTYEYDTGANTITHFGHGGRDCATIHIELFDEFEQRLSLSENTHLDLEFVVRSILS